ncbi:LacI family DNA-binding transcriptional regulator [Streptomyces solaniscabiei]|uniref:LacI family DNA-binding transcriptional regulator n=1 Tax=Streptomyces solaniscabiei TaxID=2683255 RepID=UPI001CE2978B|nr:LacI family DNA-binding transcriptional regulator [Streptomyces solaniscabiei]
MNPPRGEETPPPATSAPIRSSPTLSKVAAAAGVSKATASRVLHGGKQVSPDLTARVHSAARELGYVPDIAAQALRGRRDVLALLADDVGTEAVGAMVTALERAAHRDGLVATVSAAGGNPVQQLQLLNTVRAMRPRGLILTGTWLTAPEIQDELRQSLDAYTRDGDSRLVVIGRPHSHYPSIGFDDYGAGVAVAQHMARRHLRSVAVLGGPRHHHAYRDRTVGFREGLTEAGVHHIHVTHSQASPSGAAQALADALREHGVPDAVLAVNDRIATGALHALRDAGLDVPGDVALTGIDDIPLAQDLSPALTTIAFPFDIAGREAVRIVTSDRPQDTPRRTVLGGHLVVRDSCGLKH